MTRQERWSPVGSQGGRAIRQTITVVQGGDRSLPVRYPLGFLSLIDHLPSLQPGVVVLLARPSLPGEVYTAWSYPGAAVPGQYEFDPREYLRLPAHLASGLDELSRNLERGCPDLGSFLGAIDRYLDRTCRYTLVYAPIAGDDIVSSFLFRTRRGSCKLFASSAAVLLRLRGVPARLVSGFARGDPDPVSRELVVREDHAHAWCEVFQPGSGWITFDPTPPDPASSAAAGSAPSGPGGGRPSLPPAAARRATPAMVWEEPVAPPPLRRPALPSKAPVAPPPDPPGAAVPMKSVPPRNVPARSASPGVRPGSTRESRSPEGAVPGPSVLPPPVTPPSRLSPPSPAASTPVSAPSVPASPVPGPSRTPRRGSDRPGDPAMPATGTPDRSMDRVDPGTTPADRSGDPAGAGAGRPVVPILLLTLTGGLALGVLLAGGRRARPASSGWPGPAGDRPLSWYVTLMAELERVGLGRDPTETAHEFLERIRQELGEDEDLIALTDLYVKARYDPGSFTPHMEDTAVERLRRVAARIERARLESGKSRT